MIKLAIQNPAVNAPSDTPSLADVNRGLLAQIQRQKEEIVQFRRQIEDLRDRDGLTGLVQYRVLDRRLEQLLSESEVGVAVMFVDIDGFKFFNDTYGHDFGDAVLVRVADILVEVCGTWAEVGYGGGDEFMVIAPSSDSRNMAGLAEGLTRALANTSFLSPDGISLPIPVYIGIADTDSAGRERKELIKAASSSLYKAVQHRGERVLIHKQASRDKANERYYATFDVLDGLVTAIDNKDQYTRRHSEDVAFYSMEMSDALELSPAAKDILRIAGLLHDVGKIGVPDDILRKPGKLTPQEYEIMKSHVVLSTQIIHGLPNLNKVLDAVSNHHERWDGKGYPNNRVGEEVPLAGRIMILADAFSAMTLDRPYRSGMSWDLALAQIEQGTGTQFDPTLAPLFIKRMREIEGQPRKSIRRVF